jgi:hypothetical protein
MIICTHTLTCLRYVYIESIWMDEWTDGRMDGWMDVKKTVDSGYDSITSM